MANSEPLSNVDAAWLGMEDPTNLMMVSGIITFDTVLEFDKLLQLLETRFLTFRRFRQRVVESKLPGGMPYWEDDPNFDIRSHVHRIALPAPGNQEMLQEVVSDLMSTPLDFTKPLWQMHVIENFNGGCAVMARLHHCIGDGMALVMVLLSMTDFSPDAPPLAVPQVSENETWKEEEGGGALEALFKQAGSAASSLRKLTGRVLAESVETLINPTHALELALKGTDNALAVSKLVLRPPDPKTIFKGKLGVAKKAAWSRPLPLKIVKSVKNELGGTVNDVLVSAITGGLRRYMMERGESVEGLNFRAAVPVNLRKAEEMGELGNKFGLVFLSMPVGIVEPEARLAEVRNRMTALKNSQEAAAAYGILNAIGLSPRDTQEEIVKMFGSKATVVLTNVPGPPVPLYMVGSKLTGLMFWVPQSGRVSLGISIISYAGNVFLGLATDAGLVPDPDRIMEGFYQEYEALLALAEERKQARGRTKAATSSNPEPEAAAAAETAVPNPPPAADIDLQAVKGIGPTFARRLQEAGVDSSEKLAAMPSTALAEILMVSVNRAEIILAAAQANGQRAA